MSDRYTNRKRQALEQKKRLSVVYDMARRLQDETQGAAWPDFYIWHATMALSIRNVIAEEDAKLKEE